MEIHKLLKRQLDKSHLQWDEKPATNEAWLDFITRVNKAYVEAEQERYLQERSMEIFSREMMDLNEKLENAQHIAHLGYWYYDSRTSYTLWSKELFAIFNLDPMEKPLSYQQFMALVHENDRNEIIRKIDKALSDRINYECELRVKNPDGKYRWYRTIGQCHGEYELSGIFIDIHKGKEAEEKIKELSQRLLYTARRAGMAEVATTILHNIGNVLNSSNVSISLLKSNLMQPHQQKLFKIIEMLQQHNDDVVDFLTKDEKGKLIPKYLIALAEIILQNYHKNNIEIDNLSNDLQHIKEIVALQNPVSGLPSLKEKVYVPETIEIALNMSLLPSKEGSIEIIKEFKKCPLVETDKSKLLQILVNLIQNARDSVLRDTQKPVKEIKITIKKIKQNKIQIFVTDNGIGIDTKNLHRIFAFGFTTKTNGHGFGLHSSALSAQEMGGSLLATSAGVGHGAEFILTLPIKNDTGKGLFNE